MEKTKLTGLNGHLMQKRTDCSSMNPHAVNSG
jgi:hypothetical protein